MQGNCKLIKRLLHYIVKDRKPSKPDHWKSQLHRVIEIVYTYGRLRNVYLEDDKDIQVVNRSEMKKSSVKYNHEPDVVDGEYQPGARDIIW